MRRHPCINQNTQYKTINQSSGIKSLGRHSCNCVSFLRPINISQGRLSQPGPTVCMKLLIQRLLLFFSSHENFFVLFVVLFLPPTIYRYHTIYTYSFSLFLVLLLKWTRAKVQYNIYEKKMLNLINRLQVFFFHEKIFSLSSYSFSRCLLFDDE